MQKPLKVSFAGVFVDDVGTIDTIQSSLKRDPRASLLVRTSESGDQIIYGNKAKLQGVWRAPSGATYVTSGDGFVHTDATGAWEKTKLGGDLISIDGVGGHIFVGADGGLIHRFDGSAWTQHQTSLTGTSFVSKFSGSAADDVYAASVDTLFHFDGATWTALPAYDGAKGAFDVLSISRDEVMVATFWGVLTGNARNGFTKTSPAKYKLLARLGDTVYGANAAGIHRVQTNELVRASNVFRLSGSATRLAGVGSDPTLFVFDGTTWTEKQFFA